MESRGAGTGDPLCSAPSHVLGQHLSPQPKLRLLGARIIPWAFRGVICAWLRQGQRLGELGIAGVPQSYCVVTCHQVQAWLYPWERKVPPLSLCSLSLLQTAARMTPGKLSLESPFRILFWVT